MFALDLPLPKIGPVAAREFCRAEGPEKILSDESETTYGREVPCRHLIDMEVKVKHPDGTIVPRKMIDYQPMTYTGSRGADFNKPGKILEDRNLVQITAIGNCITRCYNLRDLIDLSLTEAEKDYFVFRTPEGQSDYFTPLDTGTIVLSPEHNDEAGRPERVQWCVKDESKLKMPSE